MKILILTIGLATAAAAQSVSGTSPQTAQEPAASTQNQKKPKAKRGAGGDIGSGAASIGGGVAKGAGSAAKGAAKGAVDLATLHPIDAGTAVAGGALSAGKDVTVGTAKGAGKITRGVGKLFKKVL